MSAAHVQPEETFESIVKRKLGEPARTQDLTPAEKARVMIHGPNAVQSTATRRDIVAERFVTAAERGKPWAMQLLLDRVYPRPAQEVDLNVRTMMEVVREREQQVRELRTGVSAADLAAALPDVIDVTPKVIPAKVEPEPLKVVPEPGDIFA